MQPEEGMNRQDGPGVNHGRLLEARDLRKSYRRVAAVFSSASGGTAFAAVDGVRFSVSSGETFAIVGESGCGKTTLARMLLRLIEPDGGELRFEGRDLLTLSGQELRSQRREMQMIFQDPFASLLLQQLQREFALTYVFISHSLPVVAQVATRIAVMCAGQFLEVGAAEQVLHQPRNDYTRELLSAVPELPPPERFFSSSCFSCFRPVSFQLLTVNFFSSALESPR
jgi:ABC-type glutathione transport system ATPase component